jgi:uncharacterized protein YegJ (DUF2314 family)
MNYKQQLVAAISLALMMLFACSQQESSTDSVINVADNDAEMDAAIKEARSTLPQFWNAFEKPGKNESGFSLKVGITDKGRTEYFWLMDLERRDGKVFGTIDNEPEFVHTVKLGDRIEIPDADIADWLYMRDGKMVGNRTMRALFKHMSPEEVEQYKAMLAEP